MGTQATDDDRLAEARLRLALSDKRIRLMLKAIEHGCESVEELERKIIRRNTEDYEAEILRNRERDETLAHMQERHAHPERFREMAPSFSTGRRETFDGRQLKRYSSDGRLTETILVTSGAGLGRITAVY